LQVDKQIGAEEAEKPKIQAEQLSDQAEKRRVTHCAFVARKSLTDA
jgi:hypothetical protein